MKLGLLSNSKVLLSVLHVVDGGEGPDGLDDLLHGRGPAHEGRPAGGAGGDLWSLVAVLAEKVT